MDIIDTYKRDGFVCLPNAVDPAEVNAIRQEAQAVFRQMFGKNRIVEQGHGEQGFADALYALFNANYQDFIGAARAAQHILGMHRFVVSERITQLLQRLGLAMPIVCVKPIIYFNSRHLAKIEGHYKTPSHQDWRSMQGSLNSVVIWVPLVDIDVSLGAIEFIPGSHLQGLAPTEKDTWYRHIPNSVAPAEAFVPVEVKAGDLVVFSAFAVHRSGNNVTQAIRWSIHVRYNDAAESTFIDRGMPHPYAVYRPEQELVTPDFPTPEQLKAAFA
ncbi:phytanoyl-CoA dioxygenase family protein [Hydrogenophaga sp. PML113]|uniref:phytanoyl-CoA dioxygenase family protein n=1 Tax=Hydrogenophaga sp. PML113 TaxID=1899350 RepID=UPI000878B265|nr:phytanoyl-CoA dioxygenase family protein [Hydrogenophaga sp. PML113]